MAIIVAIGPCQIGKPNLTSSNRNTVCLSVCLSVFLPISIRSVAHFPFPVSLFIFVFISVSPSFSLPVWLLSLSLSVYSHNHPLVPLKAYRSQPATSPPVMKSGLSQHKHRLFPTRDAIKRVHSDSIEVHNPPGISDTYHTPLPAPLNHRMKAQDASWSSCHRTRCFRSHSLAKQDAGCRPCWHAL